jgi:hypothetical protein
MNLKQLIEEIENKEEIKQDELGYQDQNSSSFNKSDEYFNRNPVEEQAHQFSLFKQTFQQPTNRNEMRNQPLQAKYFSFAQSQKIFGQTHDARINEANGPADSQFQTSSTFLQNQNKKTKK